MRAVEEYLRRDEVGIDAQDIVVIPAQIAFDIDVSFVAGAMVVVVAESQVDPVVFAEEQHVGRISAKWRKLDFRSDEMGGQIVYRVVGLKVDIPHILVTEGQPLGCKVSIQQTFSADAQIEHRVVGDIEARPQESQQVAGVPGPQIQVVPVPGPLFMVGVESRQFPAYRYVLEVVYEFAEHSGTDIGCISQIGGEPDAVDVVGVVRRYVDVADLMDPGVVFQDEVMDRNIAEKVAV